MDRMSCRANIGTDEYVIIARSVIGKDKTENQDSFKVFSDGSRIIVVVADGLGSAAFSKEGSKKAVEYACQILSTSGSLSSFPETLLARWKESISGNLALYDTTIKFLMITEEKMFFGGIGDGWIALGGPDRYRDLVATNTFSNQTDSILSFDITEKFVVESVPAGDYSTLLISTDGFSEDVEKESGKEFLEEIEKQITLSQENFEMDLETTLENWPVQTNCDDKTIVIIQRGQ